MDSAFNPSKRQHKLEWIICNGKYLKELSFEYENTSLLLYCCLELRTALEMLDLTLLSATVDNETRIELYDKTKSKNGIQRANDKLKSLKHKYQEFFECVCQTSGLAGKYYDFKKSEDLKYELSAYIHTYTRTEQELEFNSKFIQNAYPIIEEVVHFLESSLNFDGEHYHIVGLEFNSLPQEDKELLELWKTNKIKSKEELIEKVEALNKTREK